MNQPKIKLENVCKVFQVRDEELEALRDINIDVYDHEFVSIIGPSGCGKSTIIRLIDDIIKPTSGRIIVDGFEYDHSKPIPKEIIRKFGFVFQNPDVQLFCNNVHDEIAFGPMQMELSEKEIEKRVSDLLTLLNIEHLRDRAPYHLSGGEKKRVALASVLSMNPEVLVLDEPLAGLDHRTQDWLLDFLQELQTAGKTLIISTHDDALAHLLGDRIVYMNDDHTVDYIL